MGAGSTAATGSDSGGSTTGSVLFSEVGVFGRRSLFESPQETNKKAVKKMNGAQADMAKSDCFGFWLLEGKRHFIMSVGNGFRESLVGAQLKSHRFARGRFYREYR